MGYFYAEFFRTRKSGGMKLYGIIPVDSELHVIVPSSETKMASTPSVCSTSCIPFLIRGKTGCAECIPVHGDVTDDGYLIEMVLDRISGRGV